MLEDELIKMTFINGNQLWKRRTKHGRDKVFNDAEQLWQACCEYFEWVEASPLMEIKPFSFQGVTKQEAIPKMRAMTIAGICLYLDISEDTWARYRQDDDLSGVIRQAEQVIYEQKFTGAAAGILNANIISRDLGLSDKHDHLSTDASMAPSKIERIIVDGDMKEAIKELMIKDDV
jgi:hypothetical protein